MAGGRRRSAPTRPLVGTLEDHDPRLTVAALYHLGDVAERFPVALLELDAGPVVAQCGEADLDRAEARVLFGRVRDVEVHAQVVVGVVGLDRAPQLLVAVGADLDDPPSLPRVDAQRLHGVAAHHRGCELVRGPPAPHVHEHGERLLLVAGALDGLHEGLEHVVPPRPPSACVARSRRCTRRGRRTRPAPGTAAARPDRRAAPSTRGGCRAARRARGSPSRAPSGAATRRAGSLAGLPPTPPPFWAAHATTRGCGGGRGAAAAVTPLSECDIFLDVVSQQ